jgi:hypothetical protein
MEQTDMQTLLALMLSRLFPARGKHRRTAIVSADTPARRLITTRTAASPGRPAHRSSRPPAYLCGEDVKLIRPYLIAQELAHGIYHQEAMA